MPWLSITFKYNSCHTYGMVRITNKCKELCTIVGWTPTNAEHAEVVASDGYSWNGWLIVYESRASDKVIHSSFKTGLRYDVYSHIINCSICRKTYKGSIRQIKKAIRQMDKEWKAIMH
jgi:hypothetical protein